MRKLLKLRIVCYLVILAVFSLLVFIQQQIVIKERSKEIVSAFSQWQNEGRPVTVKQMQRQDVKEFRRLTLSNINGLNAVSFVSAEKRDKLAVGQELFFSDKTERKAGIITAVFDKLDRDTGLFPLKIKLEMPLEGKDNLVYVHINTFKDVFSLPLEILDIHGGSFYIWKVDQGRAVEHKIELVCRNGYGAIIKSGIAKGDMVIFSGQSQLRLKDKVKIIKEILQ